jgi:hypothetical protein
MKENEESYEQAKRYYGMYALLQEFVVYIQQRYIDKIDGEYVPKVDKIARYTQEMIRETSRLRALEDAPTRRAVYARNLKSLKLTLAAAKRYKKDLLAAKARVLEAQKTAKKNMLVAKNTYKTVILSSRLHELIMRSRAEYEQIGKLQVPPIIPFKNKQLEKTYKEITNKIR